jgi:subtilisin family serine protease
VLVAVVDDGTRFDHPDLAANLTSDGYDFVSSTTLDLCAGGTFDNAGDGDGYDDDPTTPAAYDWDEAQQCGTPEDLGSHGSHVAGTITKGSASLV